MPRIVRMRARFGDNGSMFVHGGRSGAAGREKVIKGGGGI